MKELRNPGAQALVAIGYSAGGLDAVVKFFDRTPCDNASYVILHHVPANSISYLRQILSNHSPLEIIEVYSQITVENNKIYLMPPAKWLELQDSHIQPLPRTQLQPNVNRSIDAFLQTFAAVHQYNKIAVFLSGNGDDGAMGASLIKQTGGKIIVQEPADCAAQSLPLHVLKATEADAVTLPGKMPAIIQGFLKEWEPVG